jgi:hypothetical protein
MLTLIPDTLTKVTVETNFVNTITVKEEVLDANNEPTLNLSNVIMVTSEPAVLTNVNVSMVSANVGVVTISGAFSLDLFPGTQIKYITRGKSDLEELAVIVSTFGGIPAGKQVFDYSSPTTPTIDVVFTLKSNTNLTAQITKTVEYNYDTGRLKLLEYI